MPQKPIHTISVQYDPTADRTTLMIPVREGVSIRVTDGSAYEGARGGFGFASKSGTPIYEPSEDSASKE